MNFSNYGVYGYVMIYKNQKMLTLFFILVIADKMFIKGPMA